MKKKCALVIIVVLCSIASIQAAFIPFRDNVSSPFSSPSLLMDRRERIPFGFKIEASSDISFLSFLSSPEAFLDKEAYKVSETLEKKSGEWWKENSEIGGVFLAFDPSFPLYSGEEGELELWRIRNYLTSTFLSSSYSSSRRAYVLGTLGGEKEVFPYEEGKNGDGNLLLSFYGRNIDFPFSWGWNVNIGYDGNESLLGEGVNVLSFDTRGEIAYSMYLLDNLSLSLSVIPTLRMETAILPSSLVLSRLQCDGLSLFSEPFLFGLGIEVDLGLSYRVNDEVKFNIDGMNLPSMRTYWSVPLSSMASMDFSFSREKDTWIEVPDVAFRAIWERDGHRIEAKIAEVVSQILWMREVEDYDFDFLYCPSLLYSYSFSPSLSLSLSLREGKIEGGVEYEGFSFLLSYGAEGNNIGLELGYEVRR